MVVRKYIYIITSIVFLFSSCKGYNQKNEKLKTPSNFKKLYSKLSNKSVEKLPFPLIYKKVKMEYYNREIDDYSELDLDLEYIQFLVLLDNGRCFKNTILRTQEVNSNILNTQYMSVGYYYKKEKSIELEIFGQTAASFFIYNKGMIDECNIILYSQESFQKKPRYIEHYVITDLILNEKDLIINW